MNNKRIGVFIVEDHKLVVDSLKKNFMEHPDFIFTGSAENGRECLEKISGNTSTNIILMDIKMEEDDEGIKTAREIIDQGYLPKIIFLTSSDRKEHVKAAIDNNISFIHKNVGIEKLYEIIKKVYEKDEMILDLGGKKTVETIISEKERIIKMLTNRQLEIACLVGIGKSNKEISELLNLSIHTINTNCKNIYAKLKCNRNQLIYIMNKSGLCDDLDTQ